MSIFKAYIHGWKNWKRWDGRTRRRDYWGFMVCHYLVEFLLYLLFLLSSEILGILLILAYNFLSIMPILAITLRRLHDTNHSALYYLVSIVPVIGNLWFFILMCTKGDYGKNDYGIDPKEVVLDDGTSIDCGDYPDFRS